MAIINGTDKSETLTGTPRADVITGRGGDDTLLGLGGNDRLSGGAGNDLMIGGDGNDIYYVNNFGDRVVEAGRGGTDEVRVTYSTYTLGPNVENLTYTGSLNFTGTGTSLNNVIRGGSGDDTLRGLAGDDTLYGFGGGNDTLEGGIGADIYYVSNIGDNVIELGRGGTDEVRTALERYSLGANVENLTYIGSAAFVGTGTALNNILRGGDGDDQFTGRAGNDRLFGNGGSDTAIFAGAHTDYSIETIGGVTTVTDLNTGDGNDGKDTLIGFEHLRFSDGTVNIGDGFFTPLFSLSSLDGGNGFRLTGDDEGGGFGLVSSAGDVNGDGFDDVIVGAPHATPDGVDTGAAYLVFGKESGWDASVDVSTLNGTNGFRLDGEMRYDLAGVALSAGDLNGDGFGDMIIGAGAADPDGHIDAGQTYVVFGKAAGWAASMDLATLDGSNGFRLDGVSELDDSGRYASSGGDVNGDGFDDLIIGAGYVGSYYDPTEAGASYVVFGKGSGWSADLDLAALDGVNGFRLEGRPNAYTANSVSSGGDINGDGFDDVLVKFIYYNDAFRDPGASYVVFGKASGWDPSVDLRALDGEDGFRLDALQADDYAGRNIAGAGDINGDGFDDVIVSNGLNPYAEELGSSSFVVFGKAAGWDPAIDLSTLDGTDGFRLDPYNGREEKALWVAGAGDINGDGLDDLLLGDWRADPNDLTDAGASYVVYGKTTGWDDSIDLTALDGTDGFRIDGELAYDHSGYHVAAAGDVNGDGFADLAIDATSAGPGRDGAAYVVFGGDFTGAVAHLGGSDNDTLVGSAADESFVGGLGDDVFISGGGLDAFQGGGGDDTVRVAGTSFFKIDGGHGDDTIELTGAGLTLDLTTATPPRISSIEIIDISGSGGNTLRLSSSDVLDLSDESNMLRVAGDAGDSVIRGAGWTTESTGGSNGDGTSTIDGQTYQHYRAGQAILLIDTDVTPLLS